MDLHLFGMSFLLLQVYILDSLRATRLTLFREDKNKFHMDFEEDGFARAARTLEVNLLNGILCLKIQKKNKLNYSQTTLINKYVFDIML